MLLSKLAALESATQAITRFATNLAAPRFPLSRKVLAMANLFRSFGLRLQRVTILIDSIQLITVRPRITKLRYPRCQAIAIGYTGIS